MKALILSVAALAIASVASADPKYASDVKPLSARSNVQYFQKNPAPDYWTLTAYYVPQETPRGCSAANLSMILNAARSGSPLTSKDGLVTFKTLVEKYADADYRDAILGKSATTGTLFSNANLTKILQSAAEKLAIPGAHPKAEFTQVDAKDLAKSKKKFIETLTQNEKSANDFVFFSFMQGGVTGDPEGGAHVATVAGYDAKNKLVLVMDPDREWYEPYWTPVDKLFAAIADPASDSRKEAGWIHFTVR